MCMCLGRARSFLFAVFMYTKCLNKCYRPFSVDIASLYERLLGKLISTSVMSLMCSSEAALRRWRAWILSSLPSPSWTSCRGEHLHRNCAGVEGTQKVQIAFIIACGISCRGNFCVQFDSGNPTSVFQLLQEACLQMGKISHSNMQKASALYQRFVYSRFMWGMWVSV